jgi:hypothetical protein
MGIRGDTSETGIDYKYGHAMEYSKAVSFKLDFFHFNSYVKTSRNYRELV